MSDKKFYSYCFYNGINDGEYNRHATAEEAAAHVAVFVRHASEDAADFGIDEDIVAEWGEVRAETVVVEAGRADWEGEKDVQMYDYQTRPIASDNNPLGLTDADIARIYTILPYDEWQKQMLADVKALAESVEKTNKLVAAHFNDILHDGEVALAEIKKELGE